MRDFAANMASLGLLKVPAAKPAPFRAFMRSKTSRARVQPVQAALGGLSDALVVGASSGLAALQDAPPEALIGLGGVALLALGGIAYAAVQQQSGEAVSAAPAPPPPPPRENAVLVFGKLMCWQMLKSVGSRICMCVMCSTQHGQ